MEKPEDKITMLPFHGMVIIGGFQVNAKFSESKVELNLSMAVEHTFTRHIILGHNIKMVKKIYFKNKNYKTGLCPCN